MKNAAPSGSGLPRDVGRWRAKAGPIQEGHPALNGRAGNRFSRRSCALNYPAGARRTRRLRTSISAVWDVDGPSCARVRHPGGSNPGYDGCDQQHAGEPKKRTSADGLVIKVDKQNYDEANEKTGREACQGRLRETHGRSLSSRIPGQMFAVQLCPGVKK